MALADIGKRILVEAEERLGVSVLPARQVQRWQTMEQEFQEFASDAEELALHSLDYFGGRPQEMRREQRRRLAQRSRIALLQDPLAGAEAELLANFGFGKGISKPTARNPAVQDVIDSAWSDPVNEQKLTGYQAQRRMSNELLTSAELFITYYTGGGKIRVGKIDADRVQTIVTDPEDANMALYYVVADIPPQKWNFDSDMPEVSTIYGDQGRLKVKYWPHWRNVEDAKNDRERLGVEDDEEPLVEPPPDKLAKGRVYHVAINQTGEQLRGNPPWARSLRFFTAMNVLTEAHVTMAQAASTFIARRAVNGSPRQITKAAQSVLTTAGELGSAAFRPAAGWGVAGNAEPTTEPFTAPGTPGPYPPGSWWTEQMNTSKLESLNLNSGAAQMAQTAQIVRAPIAASSGFGQHYLGDSSDANLATAATLELPATMRVGAWQEYFEQLYRWFTDRAIEEAVKAGQLGGGQSLDGDKPLSEMRLQEAEDRAAMEKRTDKDLSYEFSMPFPGRRMLADVVSVVQVTSQTQDPNGVNIPLRRILLRFLFEQIGIDDVSRAVEECLPQKGMPGGIGPQQTTGNATGAFAGTPGQGAPDGATGSGAGAGANDSPDSGQQPYGANSQGSGGAGDGALEAEWLEAGARGQVDRMVGDAGKLFRELVADPAVQTAMALNGSS
jgi:hypothetical protein